MSETTEQFDVLETDASRAGDTVTVVSTTDSPGAPRRIKGIVDEDGIVRQEVTDVAFNGTKYKIED